MTMSMRLAGRVALVTGASRGIGAAIALRLAADGANVVVNYHSNREAADGIVHEIVSRGGNAHALQADIKQVADVEHLIVEATRLYGGLNILVNNAGQAGGRPLGEIDEALFDSMIAANLKSVLFASQAAARVFPDNAGAIVNIGSLGHRHPRQSHLYPLAKSAVEFLTISLANALAPRGVRVNAVSPGLIDTDMLRSFPPDLIAEFLARTPLGRTGKPEEIATVVAFLVSDDASYITGETIPVGGGFR
jgi:3-oxoacyl-[acyl-carrier protein] reductase